MSNPQETAAPDAEGPGPGPGPGPGATAQHLSGHSQQVQGEAPAASLQTPAAAAATEDEESDDESEILEESPCGRWQKRKEEVTSGRLFVAPPSAWSCSAAELEARLCVSLGPL